MRISQIKNQIKVRKTLLFPLLLSFSIAQVSCQNRPHELTERIVETTIQKSLYPDKFNTDMNHTTLNFEDIKIAQSRKLHVGEVYGIPGGTTIYPVLVKYVVTTRSQVSPSAQPLYDTHNIVQKYLFYKDEFGKWVLDIVSSSDNRDVDTRRWGPAGEKDTTRH